MKRVAWILLCSACHCRQPQVPQEVLPTGHGSGATAPSLQHYFSRHEDQGCPVDGSWGPDLAPQFVHLAETVAMPPWVGIRAAKCLVQEYGPQHKDTFERWITDPTWAGLGRVVIMELSHLEEADALHLTEKALNGHLEEFAVQHLEHSTHTEVRARISQHRTR